MQQLMESVWQSPQLPDQPQPAAWQDGGLAAGSVGAGRGLREQTSAECGVRSGPRPYRVPRRLREDDVMGETDDGERPN